MKLSVRHTTRYDYETPVHFALQRVKLHPLDWPLQTVTYWQIEIDGGRIETSYRDHYGNHVDLVSVAQGAQSVSITAAGTVETFDNAGVLGQVYGRAPLWHFEQHTAATQPGPKIKALADTLKSGQNEVENMHALSAAILEAVPYAAGHTAFGTPAEQAVEIGKGVCQDHANILIAAARHAGYPARYVSGYLMMNDRVDQDASHAWAEVHLSGLGWVGFDVSNGMCPDPRYIRLAIGRDAHDAAPIYGLRGGLGDETMIVSLQVQQ
jgi:transglutaminase-like putative cysteine protease